VTSHTIGLTSQQQQQQRYNSGQSHEYQLSPWCENCKKIPNIEGENKYLVFVSYHLARAENGWRKNSQATKWIQVASRDYVVEYYLE